MRWSRVPVGVIGTLCIVSAGLVLGASGARATTEVHLAAAGDFGARATTSSVLAAAAGLNPDAFLALGDLAYTDVPSESAWCAFVKARVGEGNPFELISGNHESDDVANGHINDYSACLPNQVPGVVGTYGREYFMDFPRNAPLVRVIQASPGLTFEGVRWDYAAGDAHFQWLSNAIDSGRAAGARWIVVATHVPCWSVGVYSCPTASKAFYDLLLSKKVDLVLHGHEHAYMRTDQLRSGTSACPVVPAGSFDADCVADDDGSFTAGRGTVFATVGTGGIDQRPVTPDDSESGYFASSAGLGLDETYGLIDLRFTDTQLTARFVGTSGGTLADAFTITQGPPPPNQPPTASFTWAVQGLTASVDASASTDLDGTVASWTWDFGDGTTGSGRTAQHAYAGAGTYPVTLTVTDDAGGSTVTASDVVVQPPPPNQPPVASFTSAVSGATASFDGSASTDPDGTVASWSWAFGDGTTATGRTASRSYTATGTYPVTLTVTDDRGASATATSNVTVTVPTTTTYAADGFGRSTTNGWGTADTGGVWSITGTASAFGVNGGAGRISTTPGSGRTAVLNGVAQTSVDVGAKVSLDKAQTGSGSYVAVLGRRINATNDYRFKLRAVPGGTVQAQLVRNVGNVETPLQNVSAVPGLTYAPGDVLRTRFQVSGTGTTTLAAKVWRDGTTEPATWQLQATDTTAALQGPGSVGVWYYLSGAATISPMVLSIDDVSATSLP